jgi:hypothetical protein
MRDYVGLIANLHMLFVKHDVNLLGDSIRNFSLHHRVQNGSGAHPASYSMGTEGSNLGDKAAGA